MEQFFPITAMNVFSASGREGVPYAAYNLVSDFYRRSARVLVQQAAGRVGFGKIGHIVEVGCGVGASTSVLRHFANKLTAIDLSESAAAIAWMSLMSDPAVTIIPGGDVRNLNQFILEGSADAVISAKTFQILRPFLDKAIEQMAAVLKPGGVLAFDLGPTAFVFRDFSILAPHEEWMPGTVMTELHHPLHRLAHDFMFEEVKSGGYAGFENVTSLWPSPGSRQTFDEVEAMLVKYGFVEVRVQEMIQPIVGQELANHIAFNCWNFFFRWAPPNVPPLEEKLRLSEKVIRKVMTIGDSPAKLELPAFHPAAVFTAIKKK